MDDRRFDELTRTLSEGASRRALLKGTIGGGLAALLAVIGLDDAGAQEVEAAGACGRRCRRIKNRRRRRTCLRRCQGGGGGGGGTGGSVPIGVGTQPNGATCTRSSECGSGNCAKATGETTGACADCPTSRVCAQDGAEVCCIFGLACVNDTCLVPDAST